jgi:hypothetical protein
LIVELRWLIVEPRWLTRLAQRADYRSRAPERSLDIFEPGGKRAASSGNSLPAASGEDSSTRSRDRSGDAWHDDCISTLVLNLEPMSVEKQAAQQGRGR